MSTPGIEVRPLRQITGAAHFNEVFLTDVRVPVTNVVGEIDGGWGPARTMLANESALIGGSTQSGSGAAALIDLARATGRSDDAVTRQRLAEVWVGEHVLGWLGERVQGDVLAGRAPTLDGSVLKVLWSADRAAKGALAVSLLGACGMLAGDDAPREGFWQTLFLNRFWASIGGGTDEIHRTMIGERCARPPGGAARRPRRPVPRARAATGTVEIVTKEIKHRATSVPQGGGRRIVPPSECDHEAGPAVRVLDRAAAIGPRARRARATFAEGLGFDSVWTGESWSSDAFSPLAAVAAATSRIRLCTGIAQMSAAHPDRRWRCTP